MLFDEIQLLYDAHLYEDVKVVASFALTLSEQNPELFNVDTVYQVLCFQADSFYNCLQFRQAEAAYQHALQLRKLRVKGKGKSQHIDMTSEIDVKFRLHECYIHLKQFTEAIHTLESVSPKQRTSKINLALAKLYQKAGGNDRSAVTAYKEVLRECGLSMVAIQGLLSLGVKVQEVEQLLDQSMLQSLIQAGTDWFGLWVKAQGHVYNKDYSSAVSAYKLLDNKPLLRDNAELLACLGEAHFFNGDFGSALASLQRVRVADPLYLHKMDLMAYLHARETKDDKHMELEKLATSLVSISENAPESWVAMGYFSLATKKFPRAVYFAQKALSLDSRSIEALLLKGSALVELKKTPEAVSHFREALRLAPHRYEAYNNLINCYVAGHRMREALACASEMCKQIPTSRSFATYGRILSKEPLSLEKAKGFLEKAMKLDPNNSDAVYTMATILGQQQQYEAAIKLLKGHTGRHSSCRLHRLLADYLTCTNDRQGAAEHYCRAMRFDVFNAKAAEGLARLEKQTDSSLGEANFDVDVDPMDSSDNEDLMRTPQDQRIPPAVNLDSSASDAGDSDINNDIVFS